MHQVVGVFVRALNAIFATGMIGSVLVLVLTGIEDIQELISALFE